MSVHKFDDLLEGLTNAVTQASKLVEQQHFSILKQYFDEKGTSLIAKNRECNCCGFWGGNHCFKLR